MRYTGISPVRRTSAPYHFTEVVLVRPQEYPLTSTCLLTRESCELSKPMLPLYILL